MAKRYLPFYNNARFIALVLVGLFAIFSIIFKYLELNITINLVQFSFVLLLPLSQIYLAYKGMLDALKLDGLNQSERDRLTSTVDIRSKSSFSVHDKFHRTLILSGFCLLKIAKISLNSSFFPKPIKR